MPKAIQLHVPGPCHENWDKMTETEKGRFCLSCRKEVIDFTLMSDQQILHHISRPGQRFCGRFNNEQLNRDIREPQKQSLSWYKYFVHVMVPALLISNKSAAQESRTIGDTVVFVPLKNQIQNLTGKVEVRNETSKVFSIEGTVTDEKQAPVPFATIRIKGTNREVSADANGRFDLTIKENMKSILLTASAVGYETKEISLSRNNGSSISITLMMRAQVLGEMGVVVVRKRKKLPFLRR